MAGRWGLSLIHEPEIPITLDIVFVHGLAGHPEETWKEPRSGQIWPRDFLPKDIPTCRIYTFGYNSKLQVTKSVNVSTFSTIAESLLGDLVEQRVRDQKEGLQIKTRPIIFVAHSLGGLVLKKAILIAQESLQEGQRKIVEDTLGIVFLGTPHSTTAEPIARTLEYSGFEAKPEDTITPTYIGDLSFLLRTVQIDFLNHVSGKLLNLRIVSFFEELPVPGTLELVVDERYTLPAQFNHIPLRSDHSSICKFKSPVEPNYLRVLGELKKFVHSYGEEGTFLGSGPKVQEAEASTRILRWLQIDNGSNKVNSASAGTCDWIINTKEYTSWMEGNRTGLLWITGKPGSGKSTLLKYLSQSLDDGTIAIPRTITAFFFFRHLSSDSSVTGMYQSLLFQLLSQVPSAMVNCLSLTWRNSDCTTELYGSHPKRRPSKYEYLSGLFEKLVKRISKFQHVCLFIDALDECREDDYCQATSIISFIDSISEEQRVKICVSSRDNPYLDSLYRPHHGKITLENKNKSAIMSYVQSSISDFLPQVRFLVEIAEIIVERANGIFLWAKLVVGLLIDNFSNSEFTHNSSERFLNALPNELEGLYQIILDNAINDGRDSVALTQQLFAWLCFSRRPLSAQELADALSFDFLKPISDTILCQKIVCKQVPRIQISLDRIAARCRGLVEVRSSDSTIHFIHQSVRDFLLNNVTTDSYDVYHFELAQVCLKYLLVDAESSRDDGKSLQRETNGFLQYSTNHWWYHMKLADTPQLSRLALFRDSSWPSTKVLGHWAYLHQKTVSKGSFSDYWGWTALHASAAFGLHNLATAILNIEKSDPTRWDIGDASGRTPLSWACGIGNLDLVQVLIDARADVNTRDTRYGMTPLHWATLQGHLAVVQHLINNGAFLNDNLGCSTALSIAAARGHRDLVKFLLGQGVNPNLVDKNHGSSALQIAAWTGDEYMVFQLLKYGANINQANMVTKQTALYYATAGSHPAIVKLLLDHGGKMHSSGYEINGKGLVNWADRVGFSFSELAKSLSPRSGASSNSERTSNAGDVQQTSGKSEGSKGSSNKRRREENGSGDTGGFGDGPDKQAALEPPSASTTAPILKLACPYYKYDPGRYGSKRSCRRPQSWKSVHRLKQHLYSHHHVKLCQRCCLAFGKPEDLEAHCKSSNPCLVNLERDYADGFDDEQMSQLKARTHGKGCDELQYWKIVYRILFPNVEIASIPAPYYEEENILKKGYDEFCAVARQDPVLRMELTQLLFDPEVIDPVGRFIEAINSHQHTLPVPFSTRYDGRGTETHQPSGAMNLPAYQMAPFDRSSYSQNASSFSQAYSAPLLLSPNLYQNDSAFYSNSNTLSEGDNMTQNSSINFGSGYNGGQTISALATSQQDHQHLMDIATRPSVSAFLVPAAVDGFQPMMPTFSRSGDRDTGHLELSFGEDETGHED